MRVLVCGSREWTDEMIVGIVLDGYQVVSDAQLTHMVVIEGGAPGADAAGSEWVRYSYAVPEEHHERFPADWTKHGMGAGPIRNQRMLDEGKPDVVIAFKDDFGPLQFSFDGGQTVHLGAGGTEDMVRRAKAAGIPVYIVSHA